MNKLFSTLLPTLLSALWLTAAGQTARVQIIHNSPAPTVDVYVNGGLVFDNFAFRSATPYITLPAGLPLSVAVAPETSTSVADAIATFDLTLEDGRTYAVTASGLVGNLDTPFGLIIDDNSREAAANPAKVDVNVLHGVPDAPAVDVAVRTGGTVVANLAYGSFTGYLSLDPGKYYLDVKPAGSNDILATYLADLSALGGQAVRVLASGLLNDNPGFALIAVLVDGTVVELPLSPVARVQVIHNSPEPTVDVYANDALLIDNFAYRTATPFIFVDANVNITLAIAPDTSTSSNSALTTFNVTLENGKTYIVTASGIVGDPTTPFDLLINDAGREISSDTAKVEIAVLHGATDAPAVDVDALLLANNVISNLAYGQNTPYLALDPGKYDFAIRPTGDPTVVASFRADLSGLKGGAAYVFASGLLAGPPAFGLFAALPDGTVLELPLTPTARVQLIHNSPEPTVDVYAGNTLLVDDFAFRSATPFIDVPADRDITVGVAPESSLSAADAIATFDVNFATGSTNAVTASGIVGDPITPFTLIADTDAREAASNPAQVDFNVLHGSPDAPAVDVAVVGVGDIATNVAYGEFTPYLSVDPALYLVQIKPAGSPDVLVTYEVDLTGLDGAAARVFASGLLGGTPEFGLFAALADGTVVEFPVFTPPAKARLQVIHNSPSGTVDVYANGALLLDNFEYRTATPFIDVDAEVTINVAIAPDNSTSVADAFFSADATFTTGQTYAVMAVGEVGNPTAPFLLVVDPEAREAAQNPTEVDFNVQHGASDAPAVDVAVVGVGDIVTDLSYTGYSPYLSVPPAEYLVQIKPSGSPDVLATYVVDLSGLAGGAARVFASGLLAGPPAFGLFAALPDGTVIEFPLYTPPPPTARLQVIHNSPSGTVDVYANGALLLDNFEYRTATPFIDVDAEVTINVAIAPDNSTSAADAFFSADVTFAANKTYAVMAVGEVGNPTAPFLLVVDPEAREAAQNPTEVDFNVQHGASDAPAVDVAVVGVGDIVTDLSYTGYSPYLSVPPAEYLVQIKPAGSPDVLATYVVDISGLAGGAARVFASGLLAGPPAFGLFAALPDGTVIEFPLYTPPSPPARVQLIHNSPSAPVVDVYINGELAIDDFAFRSATPFDNAPSNTTISVGIAPPNSSSVNDVLATFELSFEPNKTYIVTASGLIGSPTTPFTLIINENAREAALDPNSVDIAVLHGSPNAPAVDVDAVFVGDNIISSLPYGSFTNYLSIPADKYDFAVRPAGSPAVVASFRADLSGLAGGAAYVFASGLVGGNPSFGLFAALPNGTVLELPITPTARVQVIHNSPEPTVDIYAGNTLLLNDFAFRTATPYINIPADRDIQLGIAPANSTSAADAIAVVPANFATGGTYTVMAYGVVGAPSTPFLVAVDDNARENAASGEVAVSVFHGSPDAPAVDVAERLGGDLFTNVEYGQFTPYLDIPTGLYFIDIKVAGQAPIVATFRANLTALGGQAVRIFASGFLGGTPGFGLFAALPSGQVIELPLSPVARVQVIHNSPSPTVDVYAGQNLLIDNFEFRTATPFRYLPAGVPITLGVAPGNSTSANDVIATFPVTLENGKTYIVMASGIVGNPTTPFTLAINDQGREIPTDDSKIELTAFHGIPDAPTVDLISLVDGSTIIDDFTYGQFTDYLGIDPGLLLFDVVTNGTPGAIVGTWGADLSGVPGITGVVFATGLLDGTPEYDVWLALPNGFTLPLAILTRAQVIHNSPSPTVDVYIDEDIAIEDFEFRTATGIGLLPARTPFELSVAPGNSQSVDDAVYTLDVAGLQTGRFYILMAAGEVSGANQPFQIFVKEDGRLFSNTAATVDLTLFHGAPDAPEVDVKLPGGPVVFDNVSFGEFTDYISVPAASYILDLTPGNDNNSVLASYLADITGLAGGAATVFASGYLGGPQPGFEVWVALINGTTFPLPLYVSTDDLDGQLADLQLAPNPTIDNLWVRFELKESQNLRYNVRDLTGRLLREGDLGTVPAGEFAQQIQVGDLNVGLYLLEIASETGVTAKKFVVQK